MPAAAEQIGVDDIKYAILVGQALEPYPDNPRDPSSLMVGQDESSRWIHMLCGNFDRENLIKKSLEIDYPRSKTTGYSANFILT